MFLSNEIFVEEILSNFHLTVWGHDVFVENIFVEFSAGHFFIFAQGKRGVEAAGREARKESRRLGGAEGARWNRGVKWSRVRERSSWVNYVNKHVCISTCMWSCVERFRFIGILFLAV